MSDVAETKLYVEILKLILESLSLEKTDVEGCTKFYEKLQEQFQNLHKQKLEDGFIGFLREQYANDEEVYELLLRYITDCTEEHITRCELMEILLSKSLREKRNIYILWELKKCIRAERFHLGKCPDMREDFELYQYMSNAMAETLGVSYDKIPPEERDKDCIVFTTTQFLGLRHAPTKLMLEFARIMTKQMKKKVLIINALKVVDEESRTIVGTKNYNEQSYIQGKAGKFQYPYQQDTFEVYQLLIGQDNENEIKQLVREVYELKPWCVWHFGGIPVFAQVLQQFTTLVYMAFNKGYPLVPADIVVNYFAASPIENRAERNFLTEHGVLVQDIRIGLKLTELQGDVKRTDYDIPETAFCISIVGNRLSSDCTDKFLRLVAGAWEQECDIYVIFIGPTNEKFQKKVQREMGDASHIRFLGEQKRLQGAIAMTDLFVNPPRVGGGAGAHLALLEGIPIITLKNCDVASLAGDGFCYENPASLPEWIVRYKRDTAFYEEQSKAARVKGKECEKSDEEHAAMLSSVFDLVAD